MTPEEFLADVRTRLAAASADDASRRVRCDVCQAMTREPERHRALHGIDPITEETA